MTLKLNRKGDTRLILIISYTSFLFFLIAVLPLTPFPDAIAFAGGTDISPPICEIGGWTAILDAILCGFGYIGFFVSLMLVSVGTGFEMLWLIVFSPLLVGIGWALLTLLRGS